MKHFILTCIILLAMTSFVFGQKNQQKIAFVYPAGGQRGTTFEILIGGRQIQRSEEIIVSGTGVHAEILQGASSFRLNEVDERLVIARYLESIFRKRWPDQNNTISIPKIKKSTEEEKELPTIQSIKKKRLWLDLLETSTEEELDKVIQRFYYEYFVTRPDRFLPDQIGGFLRVRITIDKDAPLGPRELYLRDRQSISMPSVFLVTPIREVCEIEPNDTIEGTFLAMKTPNKQQLNKVNPPWVKVKLPSQDLPVIINGQIRAGDIDYYTFKATKGEKIVLAVQGRFLSPYLADGVPGWFSPVITVFDPAGKTIKTADSWLFDPDPIMLFDVPDDGVYAVEVRDALYRGRDDFVYRLAIGTFPFVTHSSSLGVIRPDLPIRLYGWNLPTNSILPQKYLNRNKKISNAASDNITSGKKLPASLNIQSLNGEWLPYPLKFPVSSSISVQTEKELRKLQKTDKVVNIKLPLIIEGQIEKTNEIDQYSFQGKKGEKIVIDVSAVSIGSNIDAKVDLLNSKQEILAYNDDRLDEKGPNIGLETHHADPYLIYTLPKDDTYTVAIYNQFNEGGNDRLYRMRISRPQPNFVVYATPSTFIFRGNTIPIEVTVIRQDGFTGDIRIRTKNEADGKICGGIIPNGVNNITATLTVMNPTDDIQTIALEAFSVVHDKEVVQPVHPADKMEQAFIYYHLMPRKEFRMIKPWRSSIVFKANDKKTVEIQYEKPVALDFEHSIPVPVGPKNLTWNTPNKNEVPSLPNFSFLVENPPNATIENCVYEKGKLHFNLVLHKSDDPEKTIQEKGCIIMTVSITFQNNKTKGKSTLTDYLPAIPYVIKKN